MNASSIPSRPLPSRRYAEASKDDAGPPHLQRPGKVKDIHGIGIQRQQDRMIRERDAARLKGRLLQLKVDAAKQELEVLCEMLEKRKIHNKREVDNIESARAACLASNRSTRGMRTRRPMESLLGKPDHAKVAKREESQQPTVGEYTIGAFLGKGAYGKVFTGTHSDSKKEYAIKMFDKNAIKSKSQVFDIKQEIAVMKIAQHPNIVSLNEVIESPNLVCIVMELGHMDLYSWVHYHRSNGHDMDPQVCREIILGVVKAMQHLHVLGIAHLDVKEDNILVTKDVSIDDLTQEHIKICDFGLCDFSADGFVEASGVIGTKSYFAPEMASGGDYDAQAADMFSVGCTLLNVVGKVPKEWSKAYQLYNKSKESFQNRMRVLIMMLQCDDGYLNGIAYPIAQIIRGLLRYESDDRLTAADILSHPWLAE